jgi:RNA polymerase sigma-70 factor (ECF subfamily)
VTAVPNVIYSQQTFSQVYDRNVDTVYRVCYSFMKNKSDAEDMTQEAFLRLLLADIQFDNLRHEKAWLIVTASNLCKDALRKWWRRWEEIGQFEGIPDEEQDCTVYEAILRLKKDYKTVVYMFYYEGYSTAEIALYINCPESTVRSRLKRARSQLKSMLGGEM